MFKFGLFLMLVLACASHKSHAEPQGKSNLNLAVTLYQQGLYDSSLHQLETLALEIQWKHRDSLCIIQYLGMASAKLGMDSTATVYFSKLLELDSLFQFPKNEDTHILSNFQKAQEMLVVQQNAVPLLEPEPIEPIEPLGPIEPIQTLAPIAPLTSVTQSKELSPDSTFRSDVLITRASKTGKIGLAYGALPLGSGWIVKKRVKTGLGLGALQATGLFLSGYASYMQSRGQGDGFGVRDERERATMEKWQWTQRIALSTALGAYIFSLIASVGE
jgi:hypothetical protein